MEQRLSMVTLGVVDLARSKKFYEDVVGWTAAPSPPEIVFFDLLGVVFSLFTRSELAKDIRVSWMMPTARPTKASRWLTMLEAKKKSTRYLLV